MINKLNYTFVFDMWGTLLNDHGVVATDNMQSLQDLVQANIPCIIATSLSMDCFTMVLSIINWRGVVCAEGIFINHHGKFVKEIFPNDASFNKLPQLQHLLHIFNITPSQVIYCGDSLNDLPIMQWINYHHGLTVAPANSNDIIKNTAYFVTQQANNQSWISEVIAKISKDQ